jgi:hypothetical protein
MDKFTKCETRGGGHVVHRQRQEVPNAAPEAVMVACNSATQRGAGENVFEYSMPQQLLRKAHFLHRVAEQLERTAYLLTTVEWMVVGANAEMGESFESVFCFSAAEAARLGAAIAERPWDPNDPRNADYLEPRLKEEQLVEFIADCTAQALKLLPACGQTFEYGETVKRCWFNVARAVVMIPVRCGAFEVVKERSAERQCGIDYTASNYWLVDQLQKKAHSLHRVAEQLQQKVFFLLPEGERMTLDPESDFETLLQTPAAEIVNGIIADFPWDPADPWKAGYLKLISPGLNKVLADFVAACTDGALESQHVVSQALDRPETATGA